MNCKVESAGSGILILRKGGGIESSMLSSQQYSREDSVKTHILSSGTGFTQTSDSFVLFPFKRVMEFYIVVFTLSISRFDFVEQHILGYPGF